MKDLFSWDHRVPWPVWPLPASSSVPTAATVWIPGCPADDWQRDQLAPVSSSWFWILWL